MGIIVVSEKGQVTIPQDIRAKLGISKGDPLLVDLAEDGSIRLRPAAVCPVEIYTEDRMREFAREDALTPAERRRLGRLDA